MNYLELSEQYAESKFDGDTILSRTMRGLLKEAFIAGFLTAREYTQEECKVSMNHTQGAG